MYRVVHTPATDVSLRCQEQNLLSRHALERQQTSGNDQGIRRSIRRLKKIYHVLYIMCKNIKEDKELSWSTALTRTPNSYSEIENVAIDENTVTFAHSAR